MIDHHKDSVDRARAAFTTASADLLEAEALMMRDLSTGYASGRYTAAQLLAVWDTYRDHPISGHARRWDASGCPTYKALRSIVRDTPDGPQTAGWAGPRRLTRLDPAPPAGQPVVYFLWHEENLIYVGSTGHLRNRLHQHLVAGREFTRWTAYGCQTRDHAYAAEAREIAARQPPGNKVAGRVGVSPQSDASVSLQRDENPVDNP